VCGQCGCEPAPIATPVATPVATQPRRLINLEQGLLIKNEGQAHRNRAHFHRHGLLAINLLSAPGSGKTTLLEKLVATWPSPPVGVIVGDLATDNDARRLKAVGARAIQICTGDRCHLDASLVDRAFGQLDSQGMNLLVIENVGNLVCPTAFDLGEDLRIAVLSVTEGEDKPLKYPALFKTADAVVINKTDLAAAVAFERESALANLRAVAPQAQLFELSARTGDGLGALQSWIWEQLVPCR
jgi:hydrogenase nickel incorporation protein HypB